MSAYKCPQCGSTNIRIDAEVTVQPLGDGCEVTGDITWSPGAFAFCVADGCDHEGIAEEFEVDE